MRSLRSVRLLPVTVGTSSGATAMWFCEDSVGRAELEQNHLEINCLGRKTRVALRDGRLIVLGDFADRGRRVYDLL